MISNKNKINFYKEEQKIINNLTKSDKYYY